MITRPAMVLDFEAAAVLWIDADVAGFLARNPPRSKQVRESLAELRKLAALHTRSFVNATFTELDESEREELISQGLVSPAEAAEVLNITPAAVRKAIREQRLKARKSGRQWLIEVQDLADYRIRKAEQ